MRGSSIHGEGGSFCGGNPSPYEPRPRSISPNASTPFLLVLLIAVMLLFHLATALVLDKGHAGPTPESTEKIASALAEGSPPYFEAVPTPDPVSGDAGSPINFRIVIGDPDGDAMNVTWDWGDGTFDNNTTPSSYDDPSVTYAVQRYHTYSPPGHDGIVVYTLNISVDDGFGNIIWDLTTVNVKLPTTPNIPASIIDISILSYSGTKIRANPGDELTIVANASDPDGDPLTWTYKLRDSVSESILSVQYTGRTDPGAVNQTTVSHVFSAVGIYKIILNVSDKLPPDDAGFPNNVSEDIDITVYANEAPVPGGMIGVDPSVPLVRSEIGYVLVNFTAQAADFDGDILAATWDFGDGSAPVVQTSPGGTKLLNPFVQQRNYTNAGSFNISVTITDGIPGHDVSLNTLLLVNSTNRPPDLSLTYNVSMGSYALKNEILNFTLVFADAEGDPIEVTVDFGDNSSRLYFNLTDFVGGNVTVSFSHSYAELGNYTMKIWYTDNEIGLFNHHILSNITIQVAAPIVIASIQWSWWDYTSLGLVCMIPVLVVIRFIQMSRRRKLIEEQGMTYDEWKLMKSVNAEAPPSQKEGGP